MTEGFVWDYNTPDARWSTAQEMQQILAEIHNEFVKNNGERQYNHKVQY